MNRTHSALATLEAELKNIEAEESEDPEAQQKIRELKEAYRQLHGHFMERVEQREELIQQSIVIEKKEKDVHLSMSLGIDQYRWLPDFLEDFSFSLSVSDKKTNIDIGMVIKQNQMEIAILRSIGKLVLASIRSQKDNGIISSTIATMADITSVTLSVASTLQSFSSTGLGFYQGILSRMTETKEEPPHSPAPTELVLCTKSRVSIGNGLSVTRHLASLQSPVRKKSLRSSRAGTYKSFLFCLRPACEEGFCTTEFTQRETFLSTIFQSKRSLDARFPEKARSLRRIS